MLVTAAVMFLATLRGDRISDRWVAERVVLSAPIEFLRNQSLFIIAGLLLVLLAMSLREWRGGRTTVSVAVITLLSLHIILALRDLSMQYVTLLDAILSVGAFGVLGLCFGLTPRRTVEEAGNRVMATLVLAFVLFAGVSLIEAARNIDNVMWNGRFNGATSHPVFCGVISGLATIAAAHLLLSNVAGWFWRVTASATVAVGVGFVIVSGTRTGLVVMIAASLGVFWEHLRGKRGLVLGAVAAGLFAIAAFVALRLLRVDQFQEDARIASLENTRADAWAELWAIFRQYPMLGHPGAEGESSYLLAAARGGVVGLIPFLVSVAALIVTMKKVGTHARRYSVGATLTSMGFGMLVLGVFEGFMFDTVTYPFVALLLVASALACATPAAPAPSAALSPRAFARPLGGGAR